VNIFVLDLDLEKCAKYHCDRHCVKMILEHSQMLCTAQRLLNQDDVPIFVYNKTHLNHPCNVWVRQSRSNYLWLCDLTLKLCEEYNYRYGKIHKCYELVKWLLDNPPENLDAIGLTNFALAMPDKYKTNNIVESYRNYYLGEKQHLFKWKNREIPDWIKENTT
jgi:hypothetical protein